MRDDVRRSLELYRRLRAGDGDAMPAFWARAFARLLDRHRRDDGNPWAYAALERATGGVVTQTWASNLANGRIAEPGFAKVWALTLVFGASFGEWFEELDDESSGGPDPTNLPVARALPSRLSRTRRRSEAGVIPSSDPLFFPAGVRRGPRLCCMARVPGAEDRKSA